MLTPIFGKVTYKLLDSLFAYGIFKVDGCSCNLLWGHFAIIIPANEQWFTYWTLELDSANHLRMDRSQVANYNKIV